MSTPTNEHSANPKEVVRHYIASFATGNPKTVASFVTDDFVNEQTASIASGCQGRETYEERLTDFLSEMVDFAYKIEHIVADPADDDSESCQVAVFYEMSAVWKGTTPFSMRGSQRLVVTNGYISHRTDYWDSATFLSHIEPEA